jgi:hypothetical protein
VKSISIGASSAISGCCHSASARPSHSTKVWNAAARHGQRVPAAQVASGAGGPRACVREAGGRIVAARAAQLAVGAHPRVEEELSTQLCGARIIGVAIGGRGRELVGAQLSDGVAHGTRAVGPAALDREEEDREAQVTCHRCSSE